MTDLDYVWLPPPTDLTVTSSDVHVWRAALAQPAARVQQLVQTLSADERIRAERFYFERDRNRFIVGRGLLRIVLSRYLGIAPDQLQFYYGSRGKPALAETLSESKLRFNLSHSEEMALYAVTRDREIGIDIEYIRPITEMEQIAKRFFSIQENAVFCTLPPNQKQTAFFNCWTRKEAYVKAIGDGLALSLTQFDVSLTSGEPARLLAIQGDRSAANHWSLQEVKPAPGYVAALAVEGHGWNLSCWQWQD
ncbi:4'-phosphopantetheinyl transferase superfamily protein [Chroococcidiopsis sp. CCMEE 29]|uniref:4'-phosphopantetheinyl transferase family protein n=1 Tax=Chroococcidiopsis sp. CCMEE 29 TaxID=155894 RepID=UPI0020211A15|nr:4'-phosphopantetheinyl transferase superfamily protein [Chroococcidiopsis sp. CCMEE 29]